MSTKDQVSKHHDLSDGGVSDVAKYDEAEHGAVYGEYANIRKTLDYSYHINVNKERQKWPRISNRNRPTTHSKRTSWRACIVLLDLVTTHNCVRYEHAGHCVHCACTPREWQDSLVKHVVAQMTPQTVHRCQHIPPSFCAAQSHFAASPPLVLPFR